jgi:hypothetical protein
MGIDTNLIVEFNNGKRWKCANPIFKRKRGGIYVYTLVPITLKRDILKPIKDNEYDWSNLPDDLSEEARTILRVHGQKPIYILIDMRIRVIWWYD